MHPAHPSALPLSRKRLACALEALGSTPSHAPRPTCGGMRPPFFFLTARHCMMTLSSFFLAMRRRRSSAAFCFAALA